MRTATCTIFQPSDFAPTKWSTAEQKVTFAVHFIKFLESGCPLSLFTESFYERLSSCFHHIAHYDRATFYDYWFATAAVRYRFIQHTLKGHCYGDPAFTYSDVESAIQRYIQTTSLLQLYQLAADEDQRARDLALLNTLQAKYSAPATSSTDDSFGLHAPSIREREPIQASLFG